MADASLGRRPPDDHEGLFHGLRNWLRQLTRSRNGETSSLREELEELIEEHKEEQPIDPHERTLLTNILKLHELNAADIMVPRVDIIAIEVDTPFDEAVKQIVEQGHSRVPLYRETLDDVLGMIHIKDLLPYAADGKPVPLAKIARKVLFAAPSMPVLDLLLQMRLARVHMALVVDEFGGIDGLVTIEDVIEEIVGEIEDEHDDADQPKLIERPDGSLIADARTRIAALQERVPAPLLSPEQEEGIATLGGLVGALAGRVPARGRHLPRGRAARAAAARGDVDRRARRLAASRLRRCPRHARRGRALACRYDAAARHRVRRPRLADGRLHRPPRRSAARLELRLRLLPRGPLLDFRGAARRQCPVLVARAVRAARRARRLRHLHRARDPRRA